MATSKTRASLLITAAIAAAGRGPTVARALGMAANSVAAWGRTGRMPADKITPLCDLGGNVIAADEILRAIASDANPAREEA